MLVSLAWFNRNLDVSMEKKCENSYSFEAWFAAPLAISFPVEIYEIPIVSGSKITLFGEPACVVS